MEKQRIVRIYQEAAHSKRYLLEIEGGRSVSIHEDVLVTYGLYKGMTVDEEQIAAWCEADERNKVRQAAYRYLSYRPRTAWELKKHLQRQQWRAAVIDHIMVELQEAGYLDDRIYAVEWVRQRGDQKGLGPKRLRQELINKGVAESFIEEALHQWDEEKERQRAMEIAKRRYLRIEQEPWPKIERRLGSYLARRGYSMTVIYDVLSQLREQYQEEDHLQ
jgi:regulatory protein